jgi:hypothetical protein
MSLEASREAVEAARGHGGPRLAAALVALAEREPIFGHRADAVRASIDEAARLLTAHPDPELQARVLLRLAQVHMAAMSFEAADKALEHAGALSDDPALRFWGAVRACRVAIRRGERERPAALLIGAASHLYAHAPDAPPWPDIAAEIALGIAELEIHDEDPDPSAFEALEDLARDAERPDVAFTANQLLATYALASGRADSAARALRVALELVVEHGSAEDEIETRLSLAGALVARGDAIGLQEATRHVQVARETARARGLDAAHVASLIGQAGLLARRGKLADALERCLEIARMGAQTGDAPRLVAAVGLMAELYAQRGDYASAYRTIAEAYQGLRDATGADVEPLFRPHLSALREQMGDARFQQMIVDVHAARRLADALASAPLPDNEPCRNL